MKIDTDLRAAIRSAEKAQPQVNRYEERRKSELAAIADLFKRKPALGAKARGLASTAAKADKIASAARAKLCDEYGLRADGDEFRFAGCGNYEERFVKAGGKLPSLDKMERWNFDDVMAALAKADPKEGAKIIKRLGINWQ